MIKNDNNIHSLAFVVPRPTPICTTDLNTTSICTTELRTTKHLHHRPKHSDTSTNYRPKHKNNIHLPCRPKHNIKLCCRPKHNHTTDIHK